MRAQRRPHPLRWLAVFLALALGSLLPYLAHAKSSKAEPEGPWLDRVVVSGNLAVKARRIYAIVETLWLQHPKGWEEDVRKAVAEEYELQGFPYADVQVERRTVSEGVFDAYVLIAEGPSFVIHSIQIENDKYDPEEIRDLLTIEPGMPFSNILLEEDAKALDAFFRSEGYLEMEPVQTAAVLEKNSPNVDIVIRAKLGKKVKISFRNNLPKDASYRARKKFKDDVLRGVVGMEKETFFGGMFADESVEYLSAYYESQGYKDVSVTYVLVEDEATGNKRIVFNIDPGNAQKKAKARKIRVTPVHDEATVRGTSSAAPVH